MVAQHALYERRLASNKRTSLFKLYSLIVISELMFISNACTCRYCLNVFAIVIFAIFGQMFAHFAQHALYERRSASNKRTRLFKLHSLYAFSNYIYISNIFTCRCGFDKTLIVILVMLSQWLRCVCTLTSRVSRTAFVVGLQMCWFNTAENLDLFVSVSLCICFFFRVASCDFFFDYLFLFLLLLL